MQLIPALKAWIVADQVFRQDTGKWCIIGVFDQIRARSFPAIHPSLGIWMKRSDAMGDYRMRVELHDSADRCLGRLPEMGFRVEDRLKEPEIGFTTFHLLLPCAGTYFLKLFFNEEPAGSDIRFEAVLSEE